MFLHHGELIVTSNSQVRSSQTQNRVICDVGELFNDKSGASHLLGPLVHAAAAPEGLIVVVSDGVSSNFMAQSVKVLDSRVVGVLVGNKEGALDVTPIGVLTASKDVIVEVNVVLVDGIIKSDHHHLGHVGTVISLWAKIARNFSAIFRTETVGQLTDLLVTLWGSVGIFINV